jgi:hypothetical protein
MRCPRHWISLVVPTLIGFLAGHAALADTPTASPAGGIPSTIPASVTLPFTLDHNRMIVEVEFPRPDGTVRKASAWVDTGNEGLVLSQPLATELNLDTHALLDNPTGHSVDSTSPVPLLRLGGIPLDGAGVQLRIHPGARVMPGVPADVHLPGTVLRHLHVVFDYPARCITVARPDALKPRGVPIPCRINPDTGLFLVDAVCDGETVALGVDNGSAGTWVSDRLTTAWQGRHPDWPCAVGAVGSANFFGFPFEVAGTLMHLPELGVGLLQPSGQTPKSTHQPAQHLESASPTEQVITPPPPPERKVKSMPRTEQEFGTLRIRNVGLLGLDQKLFDWYSRKSAGPVAGFIGANVLMAFRLEIDFPNHMTYWELGPREKEPQGEDPRKLISQVGTPQKKASREKLSPEEVSPGEVSPGEIMPLPLGDFDIVGLTLRPENDGGYTVAGVLSLNDRPSVKGVQPGDRLLHVDTLNTAGATMGTVIGALRGNPGATHTLVLERAGQRLTVTAMVLHLP